MYLEGDLDDKYIINCCYQSISITDNHDIFINER